MITWTFGCRPARWAVSSGSECMWRCRIVVMLQVCWRTGTFQRSAARMTGFMQASRALLEISSLMPRKPSPPTQRSTSRITARSPRTGFRAQKPMNVSGHQRATWAVSSLIFRTCVSVGRGPKASTSPSETIRRTPCARARAMKWPVLARVKPVRKHTGWVCMSMTRMKILEICAWIFPTVREEWRGDKPMKNPPRNDLEIEEVLSEPTPGAIEAVRALSGDFMVLGVGGKMGTSTAVMLRRALDAAGKKSTRVLGVSRFSRPQAKDALNALGVVPISCDLADPDAVERL